MKPEDIQKIRSVYERLGIVQQLCDEIERLQKEREAWYKALSVSSVVQRQQQEIERLREALVRILETDEGTYEEQEKKVRAIASQALNGEEPKKPICGGCNGSGQVKMLRGIVPCPVCRQSLETQND